MISPKFYSQISTCRYCKGWGIKNYPSDEKKESCTECGGSGVFMAQSGNIYVWDAPAFIDYKSRERVLMFKIVAAAIIILVLFLIFLLVRNFIVSPAFVVYY